MLEVRQRTDVNRPENRLRGSEFDSPSIAPSAHDSAGFAARGASRFAEIDCVRALLSHDAIAAAEARADAIGVGADRALIAAGALTAENYVRSLAASLGLPFEAFDGSNRAHCPLTGGRLIEAIAAGVLLLTADDELAVVVAPRAPRRLLEVVQSHPALARRLRFTTAARLNRFVCKHADRTLGEHAADALHRRRPALSAAPPRWRINFAVVGSAGLLALLAIVLAPAATKLCFELVLGTAFLTWIAFRLAGAFIAEPASKRLPRRPDDELPVYTIVAALYREAPSVPGLLASFERLDYPREKLEVLLVTEEDDRETRAAIATCRGRLAVNVIVAPAARPRTKPKALNAALPFVRGTFTVVYDAEDRPEPDQLRRALDAFGAAGDDLACVQARLAIDNTGESWLAGLFTAEYASQFDVFLPAVATLGLPLPLGGSSNHFRTGTLRAVGGCDAYNVTEDADLGMRLARFHYRVAMIDSTTFEEATARIWPWLRQRTRWFKGWLQTWAVHMRDPRRLLRDLGPINFLSFQLLVGGNVLAALVHPLFLATLIDAILEGTPMWRGEGIGVALLVVFYGTITLVGYSVSAFLGWVGLARRGVQSVCWVLALTPVHWLLLSAAAWRALYQFLFAPYHWEKTDHGAAKASCRTADIMRSLSMLERHLSSLDAGNVGAGVERR